MSMPIRVLLVDDEPDLAEMAAQFVRREGDALETHAETNPADALDRLEAEAFDCVVSDYDMPRMNGLELLAAVRETFPELPFILFTGKGSEEIASEAISAGVTDYLQKETGVDQYTVLAHVVENAVEKHRAERALRESERRFEAVFDDPFSFIGLLETDGTVIAVNRTALDAIREDAAAVEGELFWETPWWTVSDEEREKLRRRIAAAADGEFVRFRAENLTDELGPVVLDVIVRPVRGESGTVETLIAEGRSVENHDGWSEALR
ncbi:response regulator (plasmid) [Haladaptatus sp. SPP-AMP-3]|uniref:response regulator n=1 Tax=Haladaptatus sp. SPP-AMP-3 TaxID=3121295 RepID=UPI003C2D13F1